MALCGSDYKKITPKVRDPLAAGTGGREQRKGIFNYLTGYQSSLPSVMGDYTDALRTAAGLPGWSTLANLATRTAAGDFLRSTPELESAIGSMRTAGGREAADTAAGIRSQFARNGLNFSTANQQAEQAARAAATARANEVESGMRLQHYLGERANQQGAGQLLAQATATPLQYLDTATTAPLAPLGPMAEIVQRLTGGTPVEASYREDDEPIRALFKTVGML